MVLIYNVPGSATHASRKMSSSLSRCTTHRSHKMSGLACVARYRRRAWPPEASAAKVMAHSVGTRQAVRWKWASRGSRCATLTKTIVCVLARRRTRCLGGHNKSSSARGCWTPAVAKPTLSGGRSAHVRPRVAACWRRRAALWRSALERALHPAGASHANKESSSARGCWTAAVAKPTLSGGRSAHVRPCVAACCRRRAAPAQRPRACAPPVARAQGCAVTKSMRGSNLPGRGDRLSSGESLPPHISVGDPSG